MADFEILSVFWFLCMMCVAPVKTHCQLVKVFGVCLIPWKQADTVHVFQQWRDRPGHQACPLQLMCGVQTHSAADCARELDVHWVVHGDVRDQLDYRKVCALGAKESHRWWRSSLYGTVWAFLVFIGHVTLIKESSFGAETWLIIQNLKLEKGCVIEKLSSPSSKENGSTVISELENCLGTIIMCLFCISLTMVTLCWLLLWYS